MSKTKTGHHNYDSEAFKRAKGILRRIMKEVNDKFANVLRYLEVSRSSDRFRTPLQLDSLRTPAHSHSKRMARPISSMSPALDFTCASRRSFLGCIAAQRSFKKRHHTTSMSLTYLSGILLLTATSLIASQEFMASRKPFGNEL